MQHPCLLCWIPTNSEDPAQLYSWGAGGGVSSTHHGSAQSYKDTMEFRPGALNHNCLSVISSDDLCKFRLDQKNLNPRHPCEENIESYSTPAACTQNYSSKFLQDATYSRNTWCGWALTFRANTMCTETRLRYRGRAASSGCLLL